MVNINFVPDDYIQNSESRRTNLMYLVLLSIVMAVLVGSFATIKIRQRILLRKEEIANEKMLQAQEAIKQYEQLQTKRQAMMKTALTTAELLEPVPTSVLLASLTNNLPPGVSLLQLKFIQKQPKQALQSNKPATKYQAEQDKKAAQPATPKISPEKLLETHIDIEGIAPTDRQVATYMERLSSSNLLDNVVFLESKERKIQKDSQTQSSGADTTFRKFKLTAMLKKNVHLTQADIDKVRAKYDQMGHF